MNAKMSQGKCFSSKGRDGPQYFEGLLLPVNPGLNFNPASCYLRRFWRVNWLDVFISSSNSDLKVLILLHSTSKTFS